MFRVIVARDLGSLDLIYKEERYLVQVAGIQRLIVRRRIQDDLHSALICLVNDIVEHVDLILKHQIVAFFKMRQHFIHELSRLHLIGPAVEDDAVLSVLIHLDHGVPAAHIHLLDIVRMHARIRAGIQEHLSVVADDAGMPDVQAGLRQGDRLVKSLAAAVFMQLIGCHRLPAHDDMGNAVGVVYIQ